MKFRNTIQVSSIDNINLDEAIRNALDKEYAKLPKYEFTDQLEEDDEYEPTLVSVLIPFKSYHVIVTIQFANGMFDLKVNGIITGQTEISERIVVCNLWFLGNNKIHCQVLDTFWGTDDMQDPVPINNIFITENTICKVLELLLTYYFGGNRPMYKCNPDCGEDNHLDI